MGGSSSKVKTELPYDVAIPLLGIYLKEMELDLEEIEVIPCVFGAHSQGNGHNLSVC